MSSLLFKIFSEGFAMFNEPADVCSVMLGWTTRENLNLRNAAGVKPFVTL